MVKHTIPPKICIDWHTSTTNQHHQFYSEITHGVTNRNNQRTTWAFQISKLVDEELTKTIMVHIFLLVCIEVLSFASS